MNRLAHLLRAQSEKLNLFSAKDRELLEEKHLPDALAVLECWAPKAGEKVIDVGTGGGLPGLALAEALPELFFTLVDARLKKVEAVMEVAEALVLNNVEGVAERFEDLAHTSGYRGGFDIALARAVAPLPVLLEYVAGFLKVDGLFYAWKGPDAPLELEAAAGAMKLLGMEFIKTHEYHLPSCEKRCILIFQKKKSLSKEYPRRTGIPKQKPL